MARHMGTLSPEPGPETPTSLSGSRKWTSGTHIVQVTCAQTFFLPRRPGFMARLSVLGHSSHLHNASQRADNCQHGPGSDKPRKVDHELGCFNAGLAQLTLPSAGQPCLRLRGCEPKTVFVHELATRRARHQRVLLSRTAFLLAVTVSHHATAATRLHRRHRLRLGRAGVRCTSCGTGARPPTAIATPSSIGTAGPRGRAAAITAAATCVAPLVAVAVALVAVTAGADVAVTTIIASGSWRWRGTLARRPPPCRRGFGRLRRCGSACSWATPTRGCWRGHVMSPPLATCQTRRCAARGGRACGAATRPTGGSARCHIPSAPTACATPLPGHGDRRRRQPEDVGREANCGSYFATGRINPW